MLKHSRECPLKTIESHKLPLQLFPFTNPILSIGSFIFLQALGSESELILLTSGFFITAVTVMILDELSSPLLVEELILMSNHVFECSVSTQWESSV